MTEVMDQGKFEIPAQLSVLPLRNMVFFPGVPTRLLVGRKGSLQLINQAVEHGRLIAIAAQRDMAIDDPEPDDVYDIGIVAFIHHVIKLPDEHLQVLVHGIRRVQFTSFLQKTPYLIAKLEVMQEKILGTEQELALAQNLSRQFQKMVSLAPAMGDELQITAINMERQPAQLADFIASELEVAVEEKQEILREMVVQRRLERLTVLLNRELSILEMGHKIQSQVQKEIGQAQQQHYLREQMKIIQKELGESGNDELSDLSQQLKSAKLPDEVRQAATRELERLGHLPAAAAEYTVVRTYLDWLLAVPWRKAALRSIDIRRAHHILDADHQGLDKVKERILEYLSVRKLKKDSKGPIFCFVGPPGVGKTSLGRSIARTLGRKFVRIALGGVHDESEIRGHRRTYVGALPGRIIQGLRKVGVNNPVFMLDEIDKLGADFRGDPAAALLEVLDPEQNSTFEDHYLDLPFDLSKVTFITTANRLDTIPAALKDRLEVIELSGYTEEEKLQIAQRHLLPRQLKEHGLSKRKVLFQEDALRTLIRGYTQEAGVRNLEREIGHVCRKLARQIVEGRSGALVIARGDLRGLLGPEKVRLTVGEEITSPGVVPGLAWTPFGGEAMFVEATKMKGNKGLTLTGQLGEVMKESAQIALSYLRAHGKEWGIDQNFLIDQDIHIHLPSGAVPKDGPSAGVTVATALLSLLTGRLVHKGLAMTGEITLRGRVLPVGGVKEKVLAAHRAGFTTTILPRRNEKDLDALPIGVRQEMKFILVEQLAEVFAASLTDQLERQAA